MPSVAPSPYRSTRGDVGVAAQLHLLEVAEQFIGLVERPPGHPSICLAETDGERHAAMIMATAETRQGLKSFESGP
jgi:hypothetical protein